MLGSYHTELAAYAGHAQRAGAVRDADEHRAVDVLRRLRRRPLAESPASDERLRALGIEADRIGRWDRGVDLSRFDPALRTPGLFGEIDGVYVLYAGRQTKEKGVDLLADAFLAARRRDPRLHLALAGGGPEEEALRARLGDAATFLGWLEGDDLARAYATADAFLFASRTDTFGQVILEAQASGLPVVAVGEGGPASLIEDGETGLLAPPDADALADAVLSIVEGPLLAERLRVGGLAAVRTRTWDAALQRLADGYRRALAASDADATRVAA